MSSYALIDELEKKLREISEKIFIIKTEQLHEVTRMQKRIEDLTVESAALFQKLDMAGADPDVDVPEEVTSKNYVIMDTLYPTAEETNHVDFEVNQLRSKIYEANQRLWKLQIAEQLKLEGLYQKVAGLTYEIDTRKSRLAELEEKQPSPKKQKKSN